MTFEVVSQRDGSLLELLCDPLGVGRELRVGTQPQDQVDDVRIFGLLDLAGLRTVGVRAHGSCCRLLCPLAIR